MDSERALEQIGGFAERAERQTAEALRRERRRSDWDLRATASRQSAIEPASFFAM